MTIWFVATIPVLIMVFALAMERLENRLRRLAVQENGVEELLEPARPDEIRALNRSRFDGARDVFRLRRPRRNTPVPPRSARQRA